MRGTTLRLGATALLTTASSDFVQHRVRTATALLAVFVDGLRDATVDDTIQGLRVRTIATGIQAAVLGMLFGAPCSLLRDVWTEAGVVGWRPGGHRNVSGAATR